MTQPELKVELDELMKRAAELEEFADKLVADFPADNPLPPCGLPFVLEGTSRGQSAGLGRVADKRGQSL
jgi:hypothetical protein